MSTLRSGETITTNAGSFVAPSVTIAIVLTTRLGTRFAGPHWLALTKALVGTGTVSTAFFQTRFLTTHDASPHLPFETRFLLAHRLALAMFGDRIACSVEHVAHTALGSSVTIVASADAQNTFTMAKASLGTGLNLACVALEAFSA